jgi:3-hydroxyisobutyrate dehydrogenase-like beta-hydroxyacid dehydrogenase
MANLSYIGLGMMGGRMAARLLSKGHAVTGYNRTRSKAEALAGDGLRIAGTPREAAAAADVTFVMVANSEALKSVADGDDGFIAGMSAGKVIVDMSTVSPALSRELASRVREAGADMVDAPVSGSVLTLEQGKLSIMVGGDRATFDRLKPLLEDIGPKVTYVGANGLAVAMKIATNISVAVQMLAFAEGVLLAEKSGIARQTAVEVMTHSAIGSPMLQYRGPFVLQMPGEAWFNTTMMQKDLRLALEMGRELGVPLPTTSTTNEWLTATRAIGLADDDFAAVFQALARAAGEQR